MSGDVCTCGHSFIDAEDFRDHMPCPGSAGEQLLGQLAARADKYEKALRAITKLGRVCPEFDLCAHQACADSCGAVLLALEALK
jgi:hypothetical protein